MTYEVHPLADIVPSMTEEEFARLREDIRENGLREPVTLYEGKILDGRHRYRACEELGVKLKTARYTGYEPERFVASMNVARRHLTHTQITVIGVSLLEAAEKRALQRKAAGGAKAAPGRPAEKDSADRHSVSTGRATEEVADLLGVSARGLARAKRVSKEDPELFEQIKQGEISIDAAHTKVAEKARSRKRDLSQPFTVNTEHDQMLAAAAKRTLNNGITTIEGAAKGMATFDVLRAKAGATNEELAEWVRSLRDSVKVFRSVLKKLGD